MLKIVVLVKQVPNTTQVRIDPETNNLIRDGIPSIVNPYDLHAIEAALSLKEKLGANVTALSMGPPQAIEVLKYAMALGVDQGVLLSDIAFAGADTLATSYTLSAGIKKIGIPDIVICGKMAIDGDTAQVPVELAEHLDIGCLTNVSQVLEVKNGSALAESTMDFAKINIRVKLPAGLAVNKGINEPRLPRLTDMVRAAHMKCDILTVRDLKIDKGRISIAGSPTWVVKVFAPENKKQVRILEGTIDSQVEDVLNVLKEHEAL